MPYSITYSTKILSLAIALFLFILVGAFLPFGSRCVHFTVPSGRRDALFFLYAQIYTFSSTFIKKI